VIVFNNTKFADLQDIVNFIYSGECKISDDRLDSFIPTVQLLEVKALYFDQLDKRRRLQFQSCLSKENIRAEEPGENEGLSDNNDEDNEELATNPDMDNPDEDEDYELENKREGEEIVNDYPMSLNPVKGMGHGMNEHDDGNHEHGGQDDEYVLEKEHEGDGMLYDYPLVNSNDEMEQKMSEHDEYDPENDLQDECNGAGDTAEKILYGLEETIHNAQNETIYFNAEIGDLSNIHSDGEHEKKLNQTFESNQANQDAEMDENQAESFSVEKEIKLVDRAVSELEKQGFCHMDPRAAARKVKVGMNENNF